MSVLHYYKSPKTLTNPGIHNSPQLWHSRVVRSSNLTFEGYLASTTPVLSVGSSLFVLCRYCFEHMRTVWLLLIFQHHQFVPSVGTTICKPYYCLLDKKLHGTYSFNVNHHQQSRQQTAAHYPREASPNPHGNSGTPHQIESWPRGTIVPEERSDGYPRGRPRRH